MNDALADLATHVYGGAHYGVRWGADVQKDWEQGKLRYWLTSREIASVVRKAKKALDRLQSAEVVLSGKSGAEE